MEQKKNENVVVGYKQLPEEKLEEFWSTCSDAAKELITLYQKLPISFLKKHKDEIDWSKLSLNANTLTFEVLDIFSTKISWSSICIYPRKLSESLMYNYRNKIIWTALLAHQHLELEFLIRMSEIYRKSRSKNQKDFWNAVSRYEKIDHEYVDAYKRFINFRLLSHNPNITPETIDKYIMKLDTSALMKTVDIPKEILQKHKDVFLKK